MPEITQVGVADVMRVLPELVPLEQGLAGESSVDLLIACAGFEQRATAVVDDLASVCVQNSLIVEYPTNLSENLPAAAKLAQMRVAGTRTVIQYNRAEFLHRLQESLKPYGGAKDIRVVVDMSGMASYVVYRVLSAVCDRLPNARLAVYYAEASEYSPTESEWNAFIVGVTDTTDNLLMAEHYEHTCFQSKGIDVPYDSDVFPGENVGPLATELVAVPNFSLLRMKAMLAHTESQYSVPKDKVRWFLAQPPDRVKNGWRYDALAVLYNVRNSGEAVSTRDYREVFQRLDALWEELLAERHIVIASLGSKMQHLGTFLFLMMHRECGLVLCEPEEFIAARYTKGVGPKWWIDFGAIKSLRDALASRGDLQYRW